MRTQPDYLLQKYWLTWGPSKMLTIDLTHSSGSYPIYIAQGVLCNQQLLRRHIVSSQVLIVTNTTVAPLYLPTLEQAFTAYQCDSIILPDGEQYKNIDSWSLILDHLATLHHHRDTTIIALGGGVIGDLAGFAAACYHRGVAFIQIPTTLLSQVDASVGGKTAINHHAGKNLVGAFHQPKAVFIDIKTLDTLPDREFRAGLAEVIKTALVNDATFFSYLENNIQQLLARNPTNLTKTITTSCMIKSAIVKLDEKEQGLRALLNFGHTLAHAIESCLGLGAWLHGEAVGLGMLMAAELSTQYAKLSEGDLKRIVNLISQIKLPTRLEHKLKCTHLIEALKSDKKIKAGIIHYILLDGIGKALISDKVNEQQLHQLCLKYGGC